MIFFITLRTSASRNSKINETANVCEESRRYLSARINMSEYRNIRHISGSFLRTIDEKNSLFPIVTDCRSMLCGELRTYLKFRQKDVSYFTDQQHRFICPGCEATDSFKLG